MRRYGGKAATKTVPVPPGRHGALPSAVDQAVRAADASSDLQRSFGTDRNTGVILRPSSSPGWQAVDLVVPTSILHRARWEVPERPLSTKRR